MIRCNNNKRALAGKFIIMLILSTLAPHTWADGTEWGYNEDNGPGRWAELSSEYELCGSGENQSPINIASDKTLPARKAGIKFNYGLLQPLGISNDGKHIRVDVKPGADITVEGAAYELKYLSLHMPSEHTVNGQHFPLEIQFIHENAEKHKAGVSLMMIPGRPDRTLNLLMQDFPIQKGETKSLSENALRNLEMKKKLASYYYYNGSMTTPPCTEGMRWFIMQDPLSLSAEQQEAFKQALGVDNNRPVQALNARMVLK